MTKSAAGDTLSAERLKEPDRSARLTLGAPTHIERAYSSARSTVFTETLDALVNEYREMTDGANPPIVYGYDDLKRLTTFSYDGFGA